MEATETAAVVLGFAYVLLAIRQHRSCWIAGGLSTALYVAVFGAAGLPLQALLQLVYVAMAVYGWFAWRPAAVESTPPGTRSWPWHLAAVAGVFVAAAATVPVLQRFPGSQAPVADAIGAYASLVATWLLARRQLDAWYWWIAVDAGLAALFANQGLRMTALLYLAYALLAVAGLWQWRRGMRRVTR